MKTEPPITSSLIEKLLNLHPHSNMTGMQRDSYGVARSDAIAMVRAHEAEQPQDAVERVAKAVHKSRQEMGFGGQALWEHEPENIKSLHRSTAHAAIAAMGDGSATIAPVPAETVQPITPAITEISVVDESDLKHTIAIIICKTEQAKKLWTYSDAATAVYDGMRPYLRQSPPVDLEAGAIALSQWVYGANHGKPSWDRLSEEHRNEYREQAKACARKWGLKWK